MTATGMSVTTPENCSFEKRWSVMGEVGGRGFQHQDTCEKSIRTTGRVASGNKTRTLGTQEINGDPGPAKGSMKEHHSGLSSVTAGAADGGGPEGA